MGLDQITGVDNSTNTLNALRAGNTDYRTDQADQRAAAQRDLMKQAGGLAAQGNYSGARNALFQGGDLENGHAIQGWMNSADDRALAAANRAHAVTSGLALASDSPEKWNMSLQAANAAGLDTSRYEKIAAQNGWEAARNYAVAEHGDVGDLLKQEMTKRQAAINTAGNVAYGASDEDWQAKASALKAAGIAVPGMDGPMGRDLVLGQAGLTKNEVSDQNKIDVAAAKQKSSALEQATQNVVAGALKRYGDKGISKDDIPLDLAQAAAAGRGTLEMNGDNWVLKNPDGSIGDFRNRLVSVREKALDPNQQYLVGLGKGAAKTDTANSAREAQAVIVDRHTDLAAGLAGGWEQDNSKLSPAQLAQREEFSNSIGAIKGTKLYQTIKGEVAPDANSPAVIRELVAINQMMKAEATRLSTQGQGAVAEGVRKEFDDVIGNFAASPSVKTYLRTLQFTKKIMGEFKDVPNTGFQALQKAQGKPVTAPEPQASPVKLKTERPAGFSDSQLIDLARKKIQSGADPEPVQAQLRVWGITQVPEAQ